MSFPTFDPDEQTKIADLLGRRATRYRRRRSRLTAGSDLKRAAMRELFTRGLRGEAQKETEFGLVPESWESRPLDQLREIQTGVAKGAKVRDAEMVDVPYLRVANVQDGHLDLTEMKDIASAVQRLSATGFRLVMSCSLRAAISTSWAAASSGAGAGPLRPSESRFRSAPDHEAHSPDFFAYLAQSAYGKAYFLEVCRTRRHQPRLHQQHEAEGFPVLIPPTLDEQREIVAILDAIDRKIDLHKRKRAVLEDLFKALLHKLMTGEIRVADLDLSALGRGPL